MSAEQWQRSLRQLYDTADALERAPANVVAALRAGAPPAVTADAVIFEVIAPVVTSSAAAHERRPRGARPSPKRIVLLTLAHTAVTSALLVGGVALVDPLLPRPDAPHLAEPLPALDQDASAAQVFPPPAANASP